MGSAESVLLFACLLLSHRCCILAIIERKVSGIYVEEEPRRNYRLEDFLWSGSGDGDGSGDNEATWATTTIFRTTTILTTIYPTPVFPQPCPGDECLISPTPTFFPPGPTVTLQPSPEPPYQDLPDQKFWLVTILEANGTAIDLSPPIFEQRLARLYRTAFHRQQEKHLKLNNSNREKKTVSRERRETVSVRVHRVRRDTKDGSLELVYTVRVAGRPVDAGVAAEDMKLVADHEVTSLLGFPVLTKAEPYLKTAEVPAASERDHLLLIGGCVSAVVLVLALILVWLLLIGKKKRKKSGSRSGTRIIETERTSGQDNMAFQDDIQRTRDEDTNQEDDEQDSGWKGSARGTSHQPHMTPKPRPRSYKPSTPNSYLSMPSVKAFPRGAAKPGPLEDVFESEAPRSGGVLSRHSSESADPGVVGPLVWDLHCHRLNKKDMENSPNPELSVGRMRRRFHELLDDAFSLFGSGSASPEEAESSSAYNYGRAKSAVVLPVDPLTSDKIMRPKTTDAVRPATAGVSRVPRGAWGTTPPGTPPGSAPRPLSAGPFHTPTLDPAWILSDSSLKPTDPAVPLIKAIKSELDKFPQTGSYQT